MRCSFCALAWAPARAACIHCGDSAHVKTIEIESQPDRRLELCDGCRAYLKMLDVDRLSPFPFVSISDLDTMDLDVAAMQEGYGRPSLKEFGLRG